MAQEQAGLRDQNSLMIREIGKLTTIVNTSLSQPAATTTATQQKKPRLPQTKGKEKKTTAAPKTYIAATATTLDEQEKGKFTTITQKKEKPAPFLNREYSRLNRQVNIETRGPASDGITSDDVLRVVNRMVAPQELQFLAAFCSPGGRFQLETGSLTGANAGVALRHEI